MLRHILLYFCSGIYLFRDINHIILIKSIKQIKWLMASTLRVYYKHS